MINACTCIAGMEQYWQALSSVCAWMQYDTLFGESAIRCWYCKALPTHMSCNRLLKTVSWGTKLRSTGASCLWQWCTKAASFQKDVLLAKGSAALTSPLKPKMQPRLRLQLQIASIFSTKVVCPSLIWQLNAQSVRSAWGAEACKILVCGPKPSSQAGRSFEPGLHGCSEL